MNYERFVQRRLPSLASAWRVFDVSGRQRTTNAKEMLSRLVQLGGKMIDSSPIRSRRGRGPTNELHLRESLFLAQIGPQGRINGAFDDPIANEAHRLTGAQSVDTETSATLRDWKEGRIRISAFAYLAETKWEKILLENWISQIIIRSWSAKGKEFFHTQNAACGHHPIVR
jgi:hypothetical protein